MVKMPDELFNWVVWMHDQLEQTRNCCSNSKNRSTQEDINPIVKRHAFSHIKFRGKLYYDWIEVTKKVRERRPEARTWNVFPETISAIRQIENVFLNIFLEKAKQVEEIIEIPAPDDNDTITRITISWKHKEFIETEELKMVLLIEWGEMSSCVKEFDFSSKGAEEILDVLVKPTYIMELLIDCSSSYQLFEWIEKEISERYEAGQIPTRVKHLHWKCDSSPGSFLLLFKLLNPQYLRGLTLEKYEFVKEEITKLVRMKQWQNLVEIQLESFFPGDVENLLESDVIKAYTLVDETGIRNIIEVSS
ncbi:hypothetical protein GCK72_019970 [Caenorhabditis remanei]|uniref:DUF38 domain-containing protein n=1 Tax=Caenorhabditis remanei TaxID=31234 RepID=A0A6A5GFH1_CAERE|nr:hypothetical protein GCK72_019970 [Caenorhabditis remanei]KAF1753413.1 hypothetical protein GCK72_019970 [Caenorhabditis remanei]